MFDRRVQVLKNSESIHAFPAEGHCHSLGSSLTGLDCTGHHESGQVLQGVHDRKNFGEVVEEGDVAEGRRRVCESRTW